MYNATAAAAHFDSHIWRVSYFISGLFQQEHCYIFSMPYKNPVHDVSSQEREKLLAEHRNKHILMYNNSLHVRWHNHMKGSFPFFRTPLVISYQVAFCLPFSFSSPFFFSFSCYEGRGPCPSLNLFHRSRLEIPEFAPYSLWHGVRIGVFRFFLRSR